MEAPSPEIYPDQSQSFAISRDWHNKQAEIMEEQDERFIRDEGKSKPKSSSIGDKLRHGVEGVTKPLQSRFKTLMTRLESSTDLTELELSSTTDLDKSTNSTAYEAVDQNPAILSPKDTEFSDPSHHLPAKKFQKKTRYAWIHWGKWRVFARHLAVFAAMVNLIIIPCVAVGNSMNIIQNTEPRPFKYDCYGKESGWTCKMSSFMSCLLYIY